MKQDKTARAEGDVISSFLLKIYLDEEAKSVNEGKGTFVR